MNCGVLIENRVNKSPARRALIKFIHKIGFSCVTNYAILE